MTPVPSCQATPSPEVLPAEVQTAQSRDKPSLPCPFQFLTHNFYEPSKWLFHVVTSWNYLLRGCSNQNGCPEVSGT